MIQSQKPGGKPDSIKEITRQVGIGTNWKKTREGYEQFGAHIVLQSNVLDRCMTEELPEKLPFLSIYRHQNYQCI